MPSPYCLRYKGMISSQPLPYWRRYNAMVSPRVFTSSLFFAVRWQSKDLWSSTPPPLHIYREEMTLGRSILRGRIRLSTVDLGVWPCIGTGRFCPLWHTLKINGGGLWRVKFPNLFQYVILERNRAVPKYLLMLKRLHEQRLEILVKIKGRLFRGLMIF